MIEVKIENELGLKVFVNGYPDLSSMTEEDFEGLLEMFLQDY